MGLAREEDDEEKLHDWGIEQKRQERQEREPSCCFKKFVIVLMMSLIVGGILALPWLWNRASRPPAYLCTNSGNGINCPKVSEQPSLWENPQSAVKSWKPCAEMRGPAHRPPPPEEKLNGYLAIHAEGGLNQQRIAICNAVAVARILNVALIVPLLKPDPIWKDHISFKDIFDVEHFIEYLKDDVRILKEVPIWLPDRSVLYTSSSYTVKNIPKHASAEWYLDNVLPRIQDKQMMALKPFVNRLGYDNVPPEINQLRCRVNYHALKFLPAIEEMAETLAAQMRNRSGVPQPYMALHLRLEKGMLGLSGCDFVGNRKEKAEMAIYREKMWPGLYENGSWWQKALQKRKAGNCALEPGEVAILLVAMGYPRDTQIYVAGGEIYGGDSRMATLHNFFPNLVRKENLASELQLLQPLSKHASILSAVDFLLSLKADVFVMTHGGNFAKVVIGTRRYMGHRKKSIKPDKGFLAMTLSDPTMGWRTVLDNVATVHQTRTGLPEPTFPGYDVFENPLTPCMCKA